MNWPNRLSLLRIVCVPILVILLSLSSSWSVWAAAAVFALAAATDFLDGHLARKNNWITDFGKFMDPLADKLLVCSALICLVDLKRLPTWICIIIIAREFVISGFRLVASDNGIVIAASMWGKVKTVSQMAMVILMIANIPQLGVLTTAIMYVACALTVISLVDYIAKNRQVISAQK